MWPGRSLYSSSMAAVTSKWNCNPSAEPNRNACTLVCGERANNCAPSGRPTVSQCQCSTSSCLPHIEK